MRGVTQLLIEKVWEGVSSHSEGVGRRQFPTDKVWEGVISPGRSCREASVPQ